MSDKFEIFYEHVDSTYTGNRVTQGEKDLANLRKDTVSMVNSFASEVTRNLQNLNVNPEDFSFIHEGMAGIRYLDNQLIFYPHDMRNITVYHNGNAIDNWTVQDNENFSKKYHQVVTEELLSNYLEYLY